MSKQNLDLKTYEFNMGDYTFKTDQKLLEEATLRGFYNGYTEHNRLFSTIFFNGGEIEFKKDLDPFFKEKAFRYMKGFMLSFEPKHEEKDAICAMLMSELLVVKK